jgi:hypothetical protein
MLHLPVTGRPISCVSVNGADFSDSGLEPRLANMPAAYIDSEPFVLHIMSSKFTYATYILIPVLLFVNCSVFLDVRENIKTFMTENGDPVKEQYTSTYY